MKHKSFLCFRYLLIVCLIALCISFLFLSGNPMGYALWSKNGLNSIRSVENFVIAGIDKDGYRTDLILLCQYDMTQNSLTAMQIPRDTKVNNNRTDKKINSAYGSPGKSKTMLNEIETLVGIKVDKYIVVSFEGFRALIDEIGGVELNIPMRMYYTDSAQNLTIDLQPGKQLLDGRHAEMFMRFRQNNDGTGYPDADIGRNAAQKSFYLATANKLLNANNILKIPQILKIMKNSIKTNFSGEDIVRYMSKIPQFKMENINIVSLPGHGGYDKNGISYFYHDKEQTNLLVQKHFKTGNTDYKASLNTNTGNRVIKIKLVNACDIDAEQADVLKIVSENLSSHGFKIIETENAGYITEKSSLINHNSKQYATELRKIYKSVDIAKTIQPIEKGKNRKTADVTLIIGNDFTF